jgi:hypothetical protein
LDLQHANDVTYLGIHWVSAASFCEMRSCRKKFLWNDVMTRLCVGLELGQCEAKCEVWSSAHQYSVWSKVWVFSWRERGGDAVGASKSWWNPLLSYR